MKVPLSNGVNIYYNVYGDENKDVVVLIHHLAGSVNSWKYIYPSLSARFKVIVYDLRGHGRSSVPPSTYMIEDHYEDLKLLLEIENVKDPIIIGHSLGTLIALEYALNNPVSKIVLIGALYKAPNPEPYMKYVEIATNLGMRALAEYRREIGDLPPSLYKNERAWNDFLSVYMENNPLGYKYSVEGLLKSKDYSEKLENIDESTLLIYGSEDKLSQNLQTFLERLRKPSKEILNGYGHFLNFECPDILLQKILSFL